MTCAASVSTASSSGSLTPTPTSPRPRVRAALFYTKVHDRILGPLLSPDRPPAPQELRRAIATIDHVIEDYVAGARLKRAA